MIPSEPAKKAKEVAKISKDFVAFLETVKAEVTEGIEPDENGKLPFESMDKSHCHQIKYFFIIL